MFEFNFQRRKDKALGLFSKALNDLQTLNEDTTFQLTLLDKEEMALREAADEIKIEATNLEKERQQVLSTIGKIRSLVAL